MLRELVLRADTPLEDDVKRMIAGKFDKAGDRLAASAAILSPARPQPAGDSGDQVRGPDRAGPAASFRCAQCGEVAGVVRVARAGTTVNMGPTLGNEVPARDGLVLDGFIGTAWCAVSGEMLDAVKALIDQERVNPVAVRGISWTFCEITPFFCPDCGLNYCIMEWDTSVLFDDGLYDRTEGACPDGHQHTLDD